MSESPEADPHRLPEQAHHSEVARQEVRVSFPADDLEVFGLLLGEKLTVLSNGHSERDVNGDRVMSADLQEGWSAILIVHDVATRRVEKVTARVLVPPSVEVDPNRCVSRLVAIVRGAAKDTREKPLRPYSWASILSPRGPDSAVEPRARLALGGRYAWDDLLLEPLEKPYEGEERLAWGVARPYLEHGFRVSGTLEAPTGFVAQRLADSAVRRVSLFLSLIFRTAIEPRQQAASIVWGTPDDLLSLYPKPDVVTADGRYAPMDEAFQQPAAERPAEESDQKFRMPSDAADLWHGIQRLEAATQARVWNALGAYATAYKLKSQQPSLSLVSLVTAVEALIDAHELERCPACGSYRGVGTAYRAMIVRYTGVPEERLKRFTDIVYERRSFAVHEGVVFGGEDESLLGSASSWALSSTWEFALGD
jgi:hypothetical protein